MSTVPRLIAFDLDGTLWDPEMYQLDGGAPFRRDSDGNVYSSAGEQMHLLGATRSILQELATDPKWAKTKVAYVSRTEYPERAVPCLKTFQITETKTMFDIGVYQEIYPGSKRTHFKAIHAASKIPLEEMLFFDNEQWNCTDCAPLGITCVYTPRGMTAQAWTEGLKRFADAAAAGGAGGKKAARRGGDGDGW